MNLGAVLQTLLECAAVGFIIWGIFNEQKLINFEDKIKAAIRRRSLKVVDTKSSYNKHCA